MKDHPIVNDPQLKEVDSLDDWLMLFDKYLKTDYDQDLERIVLILRYFRHLEIDRSSESKARKTIRQEFGTANSLMQLAARLQENFQWEIEHAGCFHGLTLEYLHTLSVDRSPRAVVDTLDDSIEYSKIYIKKKDHVLTMNNLREIFRVISDQNAERIQGFHTLLKSLIPLHDRQTEINKLREWMISTHLIPGKHPSLRVNHESLLQQAFYTVMTGSERAIGYFDGGEVLTLYGIKHHNLKSKHENGQIVLDAQALSSIYEKHRREMPDNLIDKLQERLQVLEDLKNNRLLTHPEAFHAAKQVTNEVWTPSEPPIRVVFKNDKEPKPILKKNPASSDTDRPKKKVSFFKKHPCLTDPDFRKDKTVEEWYQYCKGHLDKEFDISLESIVISLEMMIYLQNRSGEIIDPPMGEAIKFLFDNRGELAVIADDLSKLNRTDPMDKLYFMPKTIAAHCDLLIQQGHEYYQKALRAIINFGQYHGHEDVFQWVQLSYLIDSVVERNNPELYQSFISYLQTRREVVSLFELNTSLVAWLRANDLLPVREPKLPDTGRILQELTCEIHQALSEKGMNGLRSCDYSRQLPADTPDFIPRLLPPMSPGYILQCNARARDSDFLRDIVDLYLARCETVFDPDGTLTYFAITKYIVDLGVNQTRASILQDLLLLYRKHNKLQAFRNLPKHLEDQNFQKIGEVFHILKSRLDSQGQAYLKAQASQDEVASYKPLEEKWGGAFKPFNSSSSTRQPVLTCMGKPSMKRNHSDEQEHVVKKVCFTV